MTTTTNKPAATLRDGRLKATIWKNAGEKGAYYGVDLTRGYQDANGNWQDSNRFGGTELLRVAHLAAKAYDELAKLRAADYDVGDDE